VPTALVVELYDVVKQLVRRVGMPAVQEKAPGKAGLLSNGAKGGFSTGIPDRPRLVPVRGLSLSISALEDRARTVQYRAVPSRPLAIC
jgi:hypothetical protein